MYTPIIYLGSDYIYNKEKCKADDKLSLRKALNKIEKEILKTGVKVIRPLKGNYSEMCMSLWVRDSSFTVHNKVYLMPQMINNKAREEQIESEVAVIPYKEKGELVPRDINLDGGDIIIDGKTIFVGKGKRTDESGINYIKNKFVDREIIVIPHHALHLDCCFGVLPGKKALYSSKYIKRMPKIVRDRYKCKKVEDLMNKNDEPNLATNYLLIGRTIITAYKKKFEKIYKYMEDNGFIVKTVPFADIFKGGGGVRCMTQWYKMPKEQTIF